MARINKADKAAIRKALRMSIKVNKADDELVALALMRSKEIEEGKSTPIPMEDFLAQRRARRKEARAAELVRV